MKVAAIIPARYAPRALRKPLADISGKPMIQWVYEEYVNPG
jgi:3-deoxy-manno-octulosonate cytidylyltransferase (CMP-KDO synthetase)